MDRLTIRTLYGAKFKGLPPYTNKPEKNKLLSEAAERLAAYEDSGLIPEEILSGKELAEIACAMSELKRYKEAEHEGRKTSKVRKRGNLMKKITVIFCGTEQVSQDDYFTGYQTKQIELTEEQIRLLKPPNNMNICKVFLED